MNELATINTTTLTNKKLAKELNTIQKCMLTVGKSEWGFAKSVAVIMGEELYKEDFETDKKLADALGIAKSTLSKAHRSVQRVVEFEALRDENGNPIYSLAKVQEMLPVSVDDFNDFLSGYEINPSMTVKEIRESVQCYKEDKKAIDETGEGESEPSNEEMMEEIRNTDKKYKITVPSDFENGTVQYEDIELAESDLLMLLNYIGGLRNE